jgi:membrane associated rhomboid family serine protease
MTVTLALVFITSMISISGFNHPDIIRKLSHYPARENANREYYRWITAGFVHADVFHLFINMFVLYFFGEFIETQFKEIHGETAGSIVFAAFYFLIIILANLPSYIKNKNDLYYHSIGASGATSGIVFSYILFRPLSMLELYFFIPIPAILFGVLYLWYSHWASNKRLDNIDHDAHFYGAVAGFLFTAFMKKELILDFFNQLSSILQ